MNKIRQFFRWVYRVYKSSLFPNIIHALVIILVFSILILCKYFKWISSDVADNIVDMGVIVTVLVVILSDIVASFIIGIFTKNHSEVLRINYQNIEIVKKYSLSNLYHYKQGKGEVIFPVKVISYKNDKKIKYVDDKNKFYNLPDDIVSNKNKIFELYKGTVIYNSINVRVDDILETGNEIEVKTSRTFYFNSLLTNRSADYVLDTGMTIRDTYEPGPYIKDLNISEMSNHIGFNGFVITSDGYIPFIIRNKNLSIGKKTLANSVGASLKSKYSLDEKTNGLKEYPFGESVLHEIYDELNVKSLGYSINDLGITPKEIEDNIICFYRDLVELGKPQFLFYTKINMTKEEVEKAIKTPVCDKTKKIKKVIKDGNKAIFFNKEELLKSISIEYNSITDLKTNKTYPVMPSASACIALFIEAIKNGKVRF